MRVERSSRGVRGRAWAATLRTHGHGLSAPPTAGREAGVSLVEILVTVIIMAIAFTAILTGMATSIRSSSAQRQHAQVQAVAGSAIERLKAIDRVPCATPATPSYVAQAQSTGATQGWSASAVAITAIQYSDGEAFGSTCYDDAVHALPLQRITLVVTHPGNQSTTTLSFVKGKG